MCLRLWNGHFDPGFLVVWTCSLVWPLVGIAWIEITVVWITIIVFINTSDHWGIGFHLGPFQCSCPFCLIIRFISQGRNGKILREVMLQHWKRELCGKRQEPTALNISDWPWNLGFDERRVRRVGKFWVLGKWCVIKILRGCRYVSCISDLHGFLGLLL